MTDTAAATPFKSLADAKRQIVPGMRFRVEHEWPERDGAWGTVTKVSTAGMHHRRDDSPDDESDWYTPFAGANVSGPNAVTFPTVSGQIHFTYHFEGV